MGHPTKSPTSRKEREKWGTRQPAQTTIGWFVLGTRYSRLGTYFAAIFTAWELAA